MSIVIIIGLALILALTLGPQWWVKRQIGQHSAERPDFPGTGGELAEHLVEHFGLNGVGVEATELGDHYDPASRTVRLSQGNFDGRSVTAVSVAAHEVGHAIQHERRERGIMLRQSLAKLLMVSDRLAGIFFMAAPLLGIFLRAPGAFFAFAVIGIGFLALRLVVALVTLPVEFDASFSKALPILREGGYLSTEDLPAARSVLRAAAWTYVAAAAMSLVNLARWVRILR